MTITHPFATPGFQTYPAFQTSLTPYVYPNDLAFLSITINGIEVKQYLDLEFENVEIISIAKQYPTATFKLHNVPPAVSITNWKDVIIYDNNLKIFGGVISSNFSQESEVFDGFDFDIQCAGYAKLLETKLVRAQKFDGKTDAYIINYLITKYLPEINASTYVSQIKTFTEIPFGRKNLKTIMEYICSVSGASYTVDFDKNLHYFNTEITVSGFGFSDNPNLTTTFPYYGFSKTDNGNGNYNVVEIVGGTYLSANTPPIYLSGNGVQTQINLPFKFHAPTGYDTLQLWINTGSDATPVWSPLVVKAGYLDQIVKLDEVLFYFEEKTIEMINPFPNLLKAIKLIGRYEAKLRIRVPDNVSIAALGREIEYPYYDDSIIDKDIARSIGKALLLENSGNSKSYSFTCEVRGLGAGIMLPIVNASYSLNESLLIQKATIRYGIGGAGVTNVEVGRYNKNLVDALLALKKASKQPSPYNEDVVFDQLVMHEDVITPTEANTLTSTLLPFFYCTTTGAATLTIESMTVMPGKSVTVYWGDTTSNTYAAGTAARTHNYAGAGTYTITMDSAINISKLYLSDNKITLNSADIKNADNITDFKAVTLKAGTFNSSDISTWRPTSFQFNSMPVGYLGTFNSADISAWRPTLFHMNALPAGYAGTFNSSDISTWRPTDFYIVAMPAGYLGTFNSADISAWRPNYFRIYSMPIATFTINITAGSLSGWITTTILQWNDNSLTQTQVNQILSDCWTAFLIRTATGGTINVGGTNSAPSGLLQAANPPTTGKEFAYELVNDSQNINPTKKWATVTIS
jgi:hypothetical protein